VLEIIACVGVGGGKDRQPGRPSLQDLILGWHRGFELEFGGRPEATAYIFRDRSSYHESSNRREKMDRKKLAALAKKNAAKSGTTSKIPKGFGKKYDPNKPDDPTDEATIRERDATSKFFSEMKKRDF
jgi:hypothetical protein